MDGIRPPFLVAPGQNGICVCVCVCDSPISLGTIPQPEFPLSNFGAPLLRFTHYSYLIVSLQGRSEYKTFAEDCVNSENDNFSANDKIIKAFS